MTVATARPGRPPAVPQYRVIPCPKCGNSPFQLLDNKRRCAGPHGCGHVWDPGEEGLLAVGLRRESR